MLPHEFCIIYAFILLKFQVDQSNVSNHALDDNSKNKESGSSCSNDSSSINSSGGDSMGSRENVTEPQPIIATEKKK